MPVGKVGEHQTSRRQVVVPWPEMGVQGPNGRTEQRPGFLTDITFMLFLIPYALLSKYLVLNYNCCVSKRENEKLQKLNGFQSLEKDALMFRI